MSQWAKCVRIFHDSGFTQFKQAYKNTVDFCYRSLSRMSREFSVFFCCILHDDEMIKLKHNFRTYLVPTTEHYSSHLSTIEYNIYSFEFLLMNMQYFQVTWIEFDNSYSRECQQINHKIEANSPIIQINEFKLHHWSNGGYGHCSTSDKIGFGVIRQVNQNELQ